jgi:hypothetical protein
MKPVLNEGKLSVELNVRERNDLAKARDIGVLLEQLHQDTGAALVAAINAILADEPEA